MKKKMRMRMRTKMKTKVMQLPLKSPSKQNQPNLSLNRPHLLALFRKKHLKVIHMMMKRKWNSKKKKHLAMKSPLKM
jgi:hypothetical protein